MWLDNKCWTLKAIMVDVIIGKVEVSSSKPPPSVTIIITTITICHYHHHNHHHLSLLLPQSPRKLVLIGKPHETFGIDNQVLQLSCTDRVERDISTHRCITACSGEYAQVKGGMNMLGLMDILANHQDGRRKLLPSVDPSAEEDLSLFNGPVFNRFISMTSSKLRTMLERKLSLTSQMLHSG